MSAKGKGFVAMRELEEIPIDPDEATDLRLHVRNCVARHTALVKLMRTTQVMTWIYRAITLPVLGAIAMKLWGLS